MATGMAIGYITDEEVARAKSLIGTRLRNRVRYNEAATKDAIRHYCDGIGDDNPLHRDESYGARTRYGHIIAPPCFLYSVWWPAGGGFGFPGVHGFHSGNDWEFFKVIHAGDAITVEERPVAVVERPSKFAGRIVLQYAEAVYRNQRDEMIARSIGWTVRAERRAAKDKGKYSDIKKATYTPSELKAIEDQVLAEKPRGSEPRYWEDVNIGDALEPVVKGPLNMTDMIAFYAGAIGGAALQRGGAHLFGIRYHRRHESWSYVDPETGIRERPEMVHAEDRMAADIGVPVAYDLGCQRMSWLGHLLTNWMGDDGFLKKFYAEIRRFNMLGDTTWCKGKVTKKHTEGDQHLVDCDIWCENQRGEITTPGRATIALPSKSVSYRPPE